MLLTSAVLFGFDIGALVQTLGFPIAALIIVVYAFVSELVVPGVTCTRVREERDTALRLLREQGERNERELSELRTAARFLQGSRGRGP